MDAVLYTLQSRYVSGDVTCKNIFYPFFYATHSYAMLLELARLFSFRGALVPDAVLPRTGRSVRTSVLPRVAGTRTHIKPTWKKKTHTPGFNFAGTKGNFSTLRSRFV